MRRHTVYIRRSASVLLPEIFFARTSSYMQIQPPHSYYASRHLLSASLCHCISGCWLPVFVFAQLHVARYVCIDTCMISQRTYSTARVPPSGMSFMSCGCRPCIAPHSLCHDVSFICFISVARCLYGLDMLGRWVASPTVYPFWLCCNSQRLSYSIFFFSMIFWLFFFVAGDGIPVGRWR